MPGMGTRMFAAIGITLLILISNVLQVVGEDFDFLPAYLAQIHRAAKLHGRADLHVLVGDVVVQSECAPSHSIRSSLNKSTQRLLQGK